MISLLEKIAEQPQFETKRLYCRPVTLADAKAMFAYASDQETTQWTFPANQSLQETEESIKKIYLTSPVGRYGLELKENGRFIGTFDLINISEADKSAEIGYILHKDYWNQGLATEVCQKVLSLAFEDWGFEKIFAMHAKENPASGCVMQKCGMTKISENPNDPAIAGKLVTTVVYELKKEDYCY